MSNWVVEPSEIPSDHKMTLVRFAPQHAPFIGKGRWSWPLGLLHDKPLNQSIHTHELELQEQLETLSQTDRTTNAQTLWQKFKDDLKSDASTAAKSQMCKISKRITALKKDLADANRDVNLDEDIHSRVNAISLDHEIDHLEKKRYKAAYDKAQAHSSANQTSSGQSWPELARHPAVPERSLSSQD